METEDGSRIMKKLVIEHYGLHSKKPGTFITMYDIEMSVPRPFSSHKERKNLFIKDVAEKPFFEQLRIGKLCGQGMGHHIFGGGAHDQMSIEEMYDNVKGGAARSFSFTVNLCMAAAIAGVGIATNSSVSTVASMLISPLMGPILALAFGFMIKEYKRMPLLAIGSSRNCSWGPVYI
jgi:hypothetical protein